jgi:hypothetical protein
VAPMPKLASRNEFIIETTNLESKVEAEQILKIRMENYKSKIHSLS